MLLENAGWELLGVVPPDEPLPPVEPLPPELPEPPVEPVPPEEPEPPEAPPDAEEPPPPPPPHEPSKKTRIENLDFLRFFFRFVFAPVQTQI